MTGSDNGGHRNLSRRNILAGLALCPVAIVIGGCNRGPIAPNTPNPASTSSSGSSLSPSGGRVAVASETATNQSTVSPAPSGEIIGISWLTRSDQGPLVVKWYERTVDAYQKKQPHVKVQIIGVPWGDYNAKLMALFAANQIPEVFADYAAGFGTFLVNGALADLTPYIQQDKVDLVKTFDKSAIKSLSRDGRLYGMPIGDDPQVLFVNQSLFEKAGLSVPPTDWADKTWTVNTLLTAARQLSHDVTDPRKGEWGLIFDAGQLGTRSWIWGVDPFNERGGPEYTKGYQTGTINEVHYTNPKFVDTMQWIADLALKDKCSPHPSDVQALQQGIGDPFMTGRIAMYAQGVWELRAIRSGKPKWKWTMAPMPYGPTGLNITELFNNAYFLGKGAKHVTEGYNFLKFLLLDEPAVDYVKTVGEWPARLDLYDEAIKAITVLPGCTLSTEAVRRVITGAFDHGFETPGKTIDRYVEFNSAWTQTSAPIWTGQVTAADGLKQVQAKMEMLVKTK